MTRASQLLAVTTVAGVAAALWLYLDNRALRDELAERAAPAAVADATAPATTPAQKIRERWAPPRPALPARSATPAPALPAPEQESRMARRARHTEEFAARFGRLDGETDEEYRARVMPMISLGLAAPRLRVAEMRREAEAKAKVTAEQSAALDQAFDKVYADVLDYTNQAVADGQLSPYERNVAGWLDYAGGLGGIMTDANQQIGKILSADQIRAMYDAGFEWSEYLGLNAPWEQLYAPPPPR